jgi:hypothetical protein
MCGVGIGLFTAEAMCKMYDLHTAKRDHTVRDRLSRPCPVPGVRYELIPGVESATPGLSQVIRVNQHGFRGPEIAPVKPANGFRIAILGDSISFGRTYWEEEIYPTLLRDRLAALRPDREIEVINASLSGRDTWEEHALLEHRVLPLEPDVVILQICMNDHVRLPPLDETGKSGAFGELPWYRYSTLLALLDRRVEGFRRRHVAWLEALGLDARTPGQRLADQVVSPHQMLDVHAHWPAWRSELIAMADLCRDRHVPILFLVFPLDLQLGTGAEETSPEIAALVEEAQIPCLDMLPFSGGTAYARCAITPIQAGWVIGWSPRNLPGFLPCSKTASSAPRIKSSKARESHPTTNPKLSPWGQLKKFFTPTHLLCRVFPAPTSCGCTTL